MVSVNLKNISSNFIEYFVFFLLILKLSNTAEVCFQQTYTLMIVAVLMLIYILKHKKIDIIIIGLFLYWVSICYLDSLFFSETFVFNKVLGYALPLFSAYFTLKIIGPSFWEKFERILYILTCIALVMYAGNILLPGIYDSLSGVFGRFIAEFYKEARPTAWYAFVYTYSPIEGLGYTRNAGFMWEPGAFAMTSIIAFIYRICKNNMKFDKHCYVYMLAIVTTFSSAGFLAIMLFFLYFFASKKNVWSTILLILFMVFIIPYIYQLEFMADKFASYIDNANANASFYNERLDMEEYNRFAVFEINMKRLLEWPLGYGVYAIKDKFGMEFAGVNGLAIFARMWGVVGIIILINGIWKTIKKYATDIPKWAVVTFLAMILTMFFSNPVEGSIILWVFCLTPFVYKRYKIV